MAASASAAAAQRPDSVLPEAIVFAYRAKKKGADVPVLLLSILGWLFVVFLFLVVKEIIQPVSIWGWVGTLTLFAVVWYVLYEAYSHTAYWVRALYTPEIRREALQRKGQETCDAIQVAVRQNDFALISDLLTNEALSAIAALTPMEGQALREAWFSSGERSEIKLNAHFDEAEMTVTSVPRKMGDPTVTVTLTYRYNPKTDNVTKVSFEFKGMPASEPKSEKKDA